MRGERWRQRGGGGITNINQRRISLPCSIDIGACEKSIHLHDDGDDDDDGSVGKSPRRLMSPKMLLSGRDQSMKVTGNRIGDNDDDDNDDDDKDDDDKDVFVSACVCVMIIVGDDDGDDGVDETISTKEGWCCCMELLLTVEQLDNVHVDDNDTLLLLLQLLFGLREIIVDVDDDVDDGGDDDVSPSQLSR